MEIYTILIALHVIGTILGTGGATLAEFQIVRSLKDKKISNDERALMHVNYGMIRVGMAILLVSVIGMFWYFYSTGSDHLWTSEKLWIKELMFVMIFINAVALHKRWVPLWLGASVSFTSWWGATLLGLAGHLPYSFSTYLLGYTVAIFAVAGVLHLVRQMSAAPAKSAKRNMSLVIAALLFMALFAIFYQVLIKPSDVDTGTEATEVAIVRELSSTVSYDVPGGSHTVRFTVGVDEDDVIGRVSGTDTTDPEHQANVDKFATTLTTMIKGKKLSELDTVDMVGKSSLTTAAFNEALAAIRTQI